MKSLCFLALVATIFFSCQSSPQTESIQADSAAFALKEGVLMIPIQTPKGEFKVFTKRVGDNPAMKVLLLHGGPGMTHEQYANFKDYLPQENIEFIWYDQLGSAHSDQPEDSTLWTIERFVDEVEQVRIRLEFLSVFVAEFVKHVSAVFHIQ